jgi:predicted Zn-dependent protease
MLSGYSFFYSGKNEDAIRLLKESAESTYLDNQPNIYLILAQAYEKTGDKALQLATLEAGKKKYPSDTNISNAVLNYYIASGQQEAMVSKLEEAIAKDPNNAELPFNLGIIYEGLAHPTTGAAPANAASYEQKAEAAYQKALSLNSEKGNYNYQLGALYFNQAVEFNKSMSSLGVGKEDQVKYNAQLKDRDALFAKALPLLEKSRDLYQANLSNLTGEEKGLFIQSLKALSQIYTIQNQLDKAKEARDLSKTIQ